MKQLIIVSMLLICAASSFVSAGALGPWQRWDARAGRWVEAGHAPPAAAPVVLADRAGGLACRGTVYRRRAGAPGHPHPRDRRWLAPARYSYRCAEASGARVVRLSDEQVRMPWAPPPRTVRRP